MLNQGEDPKQTVRERVAALRRWMERNDMAAAILANSDPHTNEYSAERWMGREWITGFHGSNGTVVVTTDKAGLWTDSRYFLIAEMAVEETGIELFRMNEPDVPKLEEWLASELDEGRSVAVMGEEVSVLNVETWSEALKGNGIEIATDRPFLDEIWEDRPAAPKGQIYPVPVDFAGVGVADKIEQVREKMREQQVDTYLLGRTDESAWLLNFKGTDVTNRTTTFCYTLVTLEDVRFFIDPDKVTTEHRDALEQAGVTLCDYETVGDTVGALDEEARVLIVPFYLNQALYQKLSHTRVNRGRAIVTDLKGRKNATEMKHLRECLVRDGAALVKTYVWIYDQLRTGAPLSEWTVYQKLEEMRAREDDFAHVSFESIVGYNGTGALNHYTVTEENDVEIHPEGVLLIDSGGTFLSGTTDTTRVIPMGKIHAGHKTDYTLVFKSFLKLMRAKFPQGTTGAQLDGICREPMWQHGRTYKHGTGHGVGFGLEVHEGPQNISGISAEKMEKGMVSTVEPGIYRPDEYGIRLENMVFTIDAESNAFGDFYQFENLTFCPFNPDLFDLDLLTDDELNWLNDYHREVLERLTPHLEEPEVEWLRHECRELVR
ncbi:MAG: M24 family metallopeptidase [Verrucomicrobiales bacterium]|nr:M24 family metallopeptidase [Verrucomicrobiales bacterium]